MKPILPTAPQPAQVGTSFRLHANLVLEIYGPGTSAKVQLTPRDALGIAQSLIFDVRAQMFQAELALQERAE